MNINTNSLIKDIFKDEVLNIQYYIYRQMQSKLVARQRNAIKAWDNFNCIINRPLSDQINFEKFKKIADISKDMHLLDYNIEETKRAKRLMAYYDRVRRN